MTGLSPDTASAVTQNNLLDVCGMACPMPLLKARKALRDVAIGHSLVVLATDPGSWRDLLLLRNKVAISYSKPVKQKVFIVTSSSAAFSSSSGFFTTVIEIIGMSMSRFLSFALLIVFFTDARSFIDSGECPGPR